MKSSVPKKLKPTAVKPIVKIGSQKQSPLVKKLKRSSKNALKQLLLSPAFHVSCKLLLIIGAISVVLYGSYVFIGKSFANEVVISQSEIVARVGRLVTLPQEEPKKVVRVEDPENLRKQGEFFKDIKEGDYILMYPNLAVIYDLRNNRIVSVKE